MNIAAAAFSRRSKNHSTMSSIARTRDPSKAETPARVLAVGPIPPPLNGTSVSFEIFCRELRSFSCVGDVAVVNTAPRRLKDKSRILSTQSFAQAWRIFGPFLHRVRSADQVLVFGSDGFLLSMGSVLVGITKAFGKRCWLRPFGGSLGAFSETLPAPLRQLLFATLGRADGVIVQTQSLRAHFAPLLGERVHVVPGYRHVGQSTPRPASDDSAPLRLVFVGHVREEKGILDLLSSMRALGAKNSPVLCDIYGPILPSVAQAFEGALSSTPNARYRGSLDWQQVVPTLEGYDALVLPTAYRGEGHPGVIIEAMMAGIPVVVSNLMPITELVEDEVNGLLVSPRDVAGLTRALERIANDRRLLVRMGERNREMRGRHDARHVVPLFLPIMGLPKGNRVGLEPRHHPAGRSTGAVKTGEVSEVPCDSCR